MASETIAVVRLMCLNESEMKRMITSISTPLTNAKTRHVSCTLSSTSRVLCMKVLWSVMPLRASVVEVRSAALSSHGWDMLVTRPPLWANTAVDMPSTRSRVARARYTATSRAHGSELSPRRQSEQRYLGASNRWKKRRKAMAMRSGTAKPQMATTRRFLCNTCMSSCSQEGGL